MAEGLPFLSFPPAFVAGPFEVRMTPDQRFARRVQAAIVLFILLFAYFLAADLWMPITPQAQLTRPVLRIAPRVDGQVLDVAVANNAHVEAGQLLFRLDPEPFRLAERAAELALEQAAQDNRQLDAALAAARAEQVAAQATASELQRETARLGRLVQNQHVSRQLFEQTEAQRQAAQAKLAAATARIHELAAQRGATGDDNLRLRQARNALAQARLQLQYSEVRAERAGVLSNLQLSPGAFLHAGSPVAALVADEADISADFREKALRYVRLDDAASVVFDALPGHIFEARVSAIDAGVKEGQLDANGDLAAPAISDRWVRDAQRQRLHVSLSEALPQALPSGAKATVQLYPRDSRLADLFGRLQIALISLLHYVY
jgi:multidrug resistance efflux pump